MAHHRGGVQKHRRRQLLRGLLLPCMTLVAELPQSHALIYIQFHHFCVRSDIAQWLLTFIWPNIHTCDTQEDYLTLGDSVTILQKGLLQQLCRAVATAALFFCWFKHKKHMSDSSGAECPDHNVSMRWRFWVSFCQAWAMVGPGSWPQEKRMTFQGHTSLYPWLHQQWLKAFKTQE